VQKVAFYLTFYYTCYIREPKSCQAALAVLVDDILRSYNDGYAIRDTSLPEGHPDRDFRMRLMLLNWIGDYKGQAKIANMKHQGAKSCHWCMHTFRKGLGQSGSNFADNNRRYLPPRSPLRQDADYGEDSLDEEDNKPPEMRTHQTIWDIGMEITCGPLTKKQKEELATSTGINGLCCLGLLPYFDICLDIMLDFMEYRRPPKSSQQKEKNRPRSRRRRQYTQSGNSSTRRYARYITQHREPITRVLAFK
jgi:hypothetical protein